MASAQPDPSQPAEAGRTISTFGLIPPDASGAEGASGAEQAAPTAVDRAHRAPRTPAVVRRRAITSWR
jgi:hypothetical protein